MSGASGFIGKPLLFLLRKRGHEVVRLVRALSVVDSDAIGWDPDRGIAIKEQFEDFDAVIHLAGEPIAERRWTCKQRKKILLSRTVTTWMLSQILAQAMRPPRIFISPSAVGYYGNRGEEELTEESSPGSGFLPHVCVEWEKAASAIDARGARTIHPRFGHVLGSNSGLLKTLLPLYRFGLGGKLGSGRQWMSWISLTDLLSAIEFCLAEESMEGVFNFTAPHPVRQEEFAKELATLLHRPSFFHLPAWFLRLMIGKMADELLLASAKVSSVKLQRLGFSFQHSTLDSALRAALR